MMQLIKYLWILYKVTFDPPTPSDTIYIYISSSFYSDSKVVFQEMVLLRNNGHSGEVSNKKHTCVCVIY